jgi:hypothetical protein
VIRSMAKEETIQFKVMNRPGFAGGSNS